MPPRILAYLLLAIVFTKALAADRPPNVVIFVADDMGYADCGVYGSKDIPTPHIDALAAGGVRFTNAYTSGCVCSPSRAGLLSGRYQQRFGFDANAEGGPAPTDRGPRALDIAQVTFAQRMKALGYATGIFGKWHQGDEPGYRPTERGFDAFYGIHPYGLAARQKGKPVQFYRGLEPVETPKDAMEAFAHEAAGFVDRHADKPFLLYLPFTAVHGPFVGPEPWLSQFDTLVPANRRKYASDLAQMDTLIGRLMAQLRSKGLEERTLVFFFSDNGGAGGATNNGPLRGTKWMLWEGGIRVPFIAQWKGRIPAGRVIDHPVMQIDLLPTAVAAAGAEVRTDWRLDGANLLPMLEGRTQAAPHDALYWRFGVTWAVRQGDWKLIKGHVAQPVRLYHLAKDVGEKEDLAAQEPQRVRELQALWDTWNAQNEAPRWIDRRWEGDGPKALKAAAGAQNAKGQKKKKGAPKA